MNWTSNTRIVEISFHTNFLNFLNSHFSSNVSLDEGMVTFCRNVYACVSVCVFVFLFPIHYSKSFLKDFYLFSLFLYIGLYNREYQIFRVIIVTKEVC